MKQLSHIDDWEPLSKPLTVSSIADNLTDKEINLPIIYTSLCCPGNGLVAYYFDGILTLRCRECNEVINQWEVAK